jgi:hypothetical protein
MMGRFVSLVASGASNQVYREKWIHQSRSEKIFTLPSPEIVLNFTRPERF